MKLPTKTLLLLLVITVISFSSAVFIQRSSVLPSLMELEANADRKDIERVVIGFDMVRHLLNTLAYEYAIRDDTYRYFFTRDELYLKNTLSIDTFVSNDFDVALLTDKQGNIIWSAYADLSEENFFPADSVDAKELLPLLADANEARPGAPISISGIINTSRGPLIFSSYSVLKSNGAGDSPGSLLFGRHLDDHIAGEVEDMVKMHFTISPITEDQALAAKGKKLSQQYRDDNNTIRWYLTDIYDQPVLSISLQLEKRAFADKIIDTPILGALLVMVISWLIIITTLNRSLVQPILTICRHLFHIRSTGDYSVRLNSRRNDEVGTLSDECDLLIQYIEQQQELVEQQSMELHRLSYEDSLTELANRRRFDQSLKDYWKLCRRDKRPVSMLMCDIDYFKKYNDNYGHQSGDETLSTVADILRSSVCRKSDLAARYGGEEFALVLPDTDEKGAQIVAERLQQKIKDAAIPHDHSMAESTVTFSIGIATLMPDSENEPQLLINQADRALYRAKAEGRNRYIFYSTAC